MKHLAAVPKKVEDVTPWMVENVHYLSRDKHGKYSPVLLASYIGMCKCMFR